MLIVLKKSLNIEIQSILDIMNCQLTNKFVRDIESSTYRVVILCKLIRMGPIVLLEISRFRLIEYSIYRDSTVMTSLEILIKTIKSWSSRRAVKASFS